MRSECKIIIDSTKATFFAAYLSKLLKQNRKAVVTEAWSVKMMPYHVYIIQCNDGSFYTGYTKDLSSRIMLHVNGKGARYTRMHRAQKLVYVEEFPSISEAMRNEKRIKRLSHRQKLELTHNHTNVK